MDTDLPSRHPDEGDAARRRRLVANERTMRRMNGRIEELNRVALAVEGADDAEQAEFLCECSRPDCEERIDIDVDSYAAIHDDPGHFIVLPGHETPEVEVVVEQRAGYLVVDKA